MDKGIGPIMTSKAEARAELIKLFTSASVDGWLYQFSDSHTFDSMSHALVSYLDYIEDETVVKQYLESWND